MNQEEKIYEKDSLEIIWQASKCIHSGNCVKNNPAVFKPKEKPWIHPENASEEEIIATIDKCPSGALSYRRK